MGQLRDRGLGCLTLRCTQADEGRCSVCGDYYQELIKEIKAGIITIDGDLMKEIKSPFFKKQLVEFICLRAVDAKVPDDKTG